VTGSGAHLGVTCTTARASALVPAPRSGGRQGPHPCLAWVHRHPARHRNVNTYRAPRPQLQSFDHALHAARLALEEAERDARPYEMTQALAALGRCCRQAGAEGVAESLLEQALPWALLCGARDLAVDLLCELSTLSADRALQAAADGQGLPAAIERARAHASEAARLSCTVSDPAWEAKVLLRVSDVFDRLGDHGDALALQSRALELMALPDAEAEPEGAIAALAHPTLQ